MGFKLETNLFDITKSLTIFVLIAFLFFNFNKLDNWMHRPQQPIDTTPIVEVLKEGLSTYQTRPDDGRLDILIELLRQQNSLALEAIKTDKNKINELTQIVTKLQAESKIQEGDKYKDPTTLESSTRDFSDTVVYRLDSNGEQLPMARVFYHPEIEDEPWTIQNFPLDFHINIIESEQEDGSYKQYVETYLTNDFVKSSKGKKYYFDHTFDWAKRELTDKKFRFNTRLGVSSNLSIDDVFPALDISFASYGKTHRDMDWRFLSLGIGGSSDSIHGYFKPVEYNVGNFIPLIENLYLGPFVGYSDEGADFGGSFSVLF